MIVSVRDSILEAAKVVALELHLKGEIWRVYSREANPKRRFDHIPLQNVAIQLADNTEEYLKQDLNTSPMNELYEKVLKVMVTPHERGTAPNL